MAPSGAFVALAWAVGDTAARERAQALGRRLEAQGGWRRAGATDRLRLWVSEARPPEVLLLPCAAGLVIGELHPAPGVTADRARRALCGALRAPVRSAEALSRGFWGRYVALLHGPEPLATAAFRDPSGGLDCLTWSLQGGLHVAASDMPGLPAWLRPPHPSLAWDRIAAFLARPQALCGESLFDGLEAVAPGILRALGPGAAATSRIWSPATFAEGPAADPREARDELVRRVDACTAALVGRHGRVIAEVSGGLDSAIVAGAVAKAGPAGRVVQWLNYRGDRREADETRFARQVTDGLGVALTVAERQMPSLDEATAQDLAGALWPPLNAMDIARDRDTAARLAACGAGALVSGQGGDAVFFQMPSPLVLSDVLRRHGPGALAAEVLLGLARRTGRSVWSVGREALAAGRSPRPLAPASSLVPEPLRRWADGLAHPWVSEDLSPARRLQVSAIASMQLFAGDSRRRRAGALVYPLLAQPVVELCLAVPTWELGGGAQDRRFARQAFQARLPEAVLRRRSKGSLTSYATRMVAGSLPFLRAYLQEGCLAEAGLLDRVRLARALDPDTLVVTTEADGVLNAVAVEAWVRHWQGRLPDSAAAPRPRP